MDKRLISIIVGALCLVMAPAALSQVNGDEPNNSMLYLPNVDLTSLSQNGFTGIVGGVFYTPYYYNVSVNYLGYADPDDAPLVDSHTVTLWDNSGHVVASAVVPAGTPTLWTNGYAWVPISTVTLSYQSYYEVGATVVGGVDPWGNLIQNSSPDPGNNGQITWNVENGSWSGSANGPFIQAGSGWEFTRQGIYGNYSDAGGDITLGSSVVQNGASDSIYPAANLGYDVGPSYTFTWGGSVNGNWDMATTNWLVGGGSATYTNGAFVQFLDGADTGTVNLTTSLSPGGILVSNNALTYTFDGSGAIIGSGALIEDGTGTLVIDNSGTNTFSGVAIYGGTLQVGNNDANGSLPSGTIADNGNLTFDQNVMATNDNLIAGIGSVTYEGSSTLQLAGSNTFTGSVLVTNDSVLQLGSASALGLGSGNTIIASGSTLDGNGYTATKPIVVSGTGVGGNGALTDTGAPIYDNPGPGLAASITLAGDTTFDYPNRWDLGSTNGGVTLSTGGNAYNLTLNSSGYFEWLNLSIDPALANINLVSGTLGIAGSTTFGNSNDTLTLGSSAELVFYGSPYSTLNKGIDFQDGAIISCTGGNNFMSGAMTLEVGYCTFDISGGTSITISNVLSGTGVFYQQGGSGTITLDGNSPSFTGGVLLYEGQLTLNGIIGSGITAESGSTVAGSGNAEGLVDVSGALLPGSASAAGTFTASGLTLENGATITMDLAPATTVGDGTNDLIVVNGNLTVNGNNININPLAGTLASGTYTLFTYTGTLNGSFGTASTSSSSRYNFTISTSTPHQVNLVVTGMANLLKWNNGAGNGQWDVQNSYNWTNLNSHVEDQFYSGDEVILDNSITTAANPSTTLNIASGAVVMPGIVTNNSSTNYSITGQGTISGGGSFVKLGSSTLSISTSNSFTGNFTIGTGTVQLNGCTAAAGATNGTLIISNGATLLVNLTNSYPLGDAGFLNKPIVVSGTGANSGGAIQFTGNPLYGDSSTYGLGQNIMLAGNASFTATGRFDWGYPGAGTTLSTHGSNYNLTVTVGDYSQWYDIDFDTNLGNIDLYTTASGQNLQTQDLGLGLGNPTNVLTLHSNVIFYIQHGVVAGGDNGYAKIVHILPTATWTFQPNGGAGDYRLNTSFILENGANLYQYSVNGGNGSGLVYAGTVTLNGLAHIVIGNAPITFSNVISGVGGFYLDNYGGYPLVFAATNTYQGITDIRTGMELSLIGNGSISTSTPISLASGTYGPATLIVNDRVDGTLTLASGQTLEGDGTVTGNLNAGTGSTLLPGVTSTATNVGTLNVSGNAMLGGNAVFKLDGGTNDELSVGTNLTYGGTLTLTNISGTPLAASNSFQLFSANGYSGSFSALSPATPGPGLTWNTNNLAVNGTLSVIAVPSAPLQITGISVKGTTLTLTGTNGADNGTYVLYETTNVTVPLTNWVSVLTNSFNSNGSLNLSTNIVNSNSPQEFYILKTQ